MKKNAGNHFKRVGGNWKKMVKKNQLPDLLEKSGAEKKRVFKGGF